MKVESTIPSSPRLAVPRDAILSGRHTALQAFWDDIGRQGAPLVEIDPEDETQSLVTLLWQADRDTHNVAVLGAFKPYLDLANNQLTRLLETDLWYRTDRVQADVRAWYRLAPNDSLEPPRDWAARTAAFQPDPLNPRRFTVVGGTDNPFAPHTEI